MKTTVLAALAALAVLLCAPVLATDAQAQPEPPSEALEQAAPPGAEADEATDTRKLGSSKPAALLWWLVALASIAGSIFVITRRNLIAAVMGMVGTFFAVAVLYAMLYAHFLAAIQVLVYAGAIMVLFVFVIMVLNKPEDHPYGVIGIAGKAVALAALAYVVYRLGSVLWQVTPADPAADLAPGETISGDDFGSTRAIGRNLFTRYLFPFEAVSIVLLTAIVGAIAVAHPSRKDDDDEAPEPTTPDDTGAEA